MSHALIRLEVFRAESARQDTTAMAAAGASPTTALRAHPSRTQTGRLLPTRALESLVIVAFSDVKPDMFVVSQSISAALISTSLVGRALQRIVARV